MTSLSEPEFSYPPVFQFFGKITFAGCQIIESGGSRKNMQMHSFAAAMTTWKALRGAMSQSRWTQFFNFSRHFFFIFLRKRYSLLAHHFSLTVKPFLRQ